MNIYHCIFVVNLYVIFMNISRIKIGFCLLINPIVIQN